jgi:hypothetical protein
MSIQSAVIYGFNFLLSSFAFEEANAASKPWVFEAKNKNGSQTQLRPSTSKRY